MDYQIIDREDDILITSNVESVKPLCKLADFLENETQGCVLEVKYNMELKAGKIYVKKNSIINVDNIETYIQSYLSQHG